MAKMHIVQNRGKHLSERYNVATLTVALHRVIAIGDNEERLALKHALGLKKCQNTRKR